MLRTVLAAAFTIFLLPGTLVAATVDRFTSFWVFGDSLSDPGNLNDLVQDLTGHPIPRPDLVDGRLTNGAVWAEHVAGDFARRNLLTGNFAFIGATAAADAPPNPAFPDVASLIPSIPQQVARFAEAAPDLGSRPIASLLGGANDLFFGGIGSPSVAAVARNAANSVADSALALGAVGVRHVLLFSLPDLGLTPAYKLFQPDLRDDATRGSRIFNATLRGRIPELRRAGLEIAEIDLDRFFRALVANPGRFNVSDATLPCVFPSAQAAAAFGQGSQICSGEFAQMRAFFSAVHPNAVIHAELAGIVRDRVVPVPLPVPVLLLVGGVAALALAARRRTR